MTQRLGTRPAPLTANWQRRMTAKVQKQKQTAELQIGRLKPLRPDALEVEVKSEAISGFAGLPPQQPIQMPPVNRRIEVTAAFTRPWPKIVARLASTDGPNPDAMFGPLTVRLLGPRGGLWWMYRAPLVMVTHTRLDLPTIELRFTVVCKPKGRPPEGKFTFTRQYLRVQRAREKKEEVTR